MEKKDKIKLKECVVKTSDKLREMTINDELSSKEVKTYNTLMKGFEMTFIKPKIQYAIRKAKTLNMLIIMVKKFSMEKTPHRNNDEMEVRARHQWDEYKENWTNCFIDMVRYEFQHENPNTDI